MSVRSVWRSDVEGMEEDEDEDDAGTQCYKETSYLTPLSDNVWFCLHAVVAVSARGNVR